MFSRRYALRPLVSVGPTATVLLHSVFHELCFDITKYPLLIGIKYGSGRPNFEHWNSGTYTAVAPTLRFQQGERGPTDRRWKGSEIGFDPSTYLAACLRTELIRSINSLQRDLLHPCIAEIGLSR
jgi:hypothetical protein